MGARGTDRAVFRRGAERSERRVRAVTRPRDPGCHREELTRPDVAVLGHFRGTSYRGLVGLSAEGGAGCGGMKHLQSDGIG